MDPVPNLSGQIPLPRPRVGPEPQRLLSTLLGDYWFGRSEHIPSAALIRLLDQFDISTSSARAAMQRLAARNLLVASRTGRTTAYGLLPRSQEVLMEYRRRLFTLGTPDIPWDELWTMVTFSIPDRDERTRRALRDALRATGFGCLYDGVWVSHNDLTQEVHKIRNDLGVESLTVFRSRLSDSESPVHIAEVAFDLPALAEKYETFLATYVPVRDRIRTHSADPTTALRVRTALMTDWRAFPSLDPRLPDELLPLRWPRSAAFDCCREIYDSLGPIAETEFQNIIAEFDRGLATLTSHNTFAGAAELMRRR